MINTANDFKQTSNSLWTVLREAWTDLRNGLKETFGRRERSASPVPFKPTDGAVNHSVSRLKGWAFMPSTVYEDPKTVIVRVDAPGMHREDFSIEVSERSLKVRGVRRVHSQVDNGPWQIAHLAYGSFCRYFAFSTPVVTEHCSAVYRDGVLRIEIQKKETAPVRRIEVAFLST